ncbi:MAG: hypothetical protein ASARMPRED_001033 [Alectoria sarmentosa]|nr:MAG: hypothetical protein ASARMPRED_001033 [Alectoria sarmentosa]
MEIALLEHGNHHHKLDTDREAPLSGNDATHDDHIAADDVADEYPSVIRRTIIVIGVALALFCVGIDLTIIATAIPKITDQFSGIELIGWYGSSFFLALACFQPFWGKVYQYFSLKYTFILAVFIFEIGSLLAGVCTATNCYRAFAIQTLRQTDRRISPTGVAPSSTVLIVGRAITGVGGAGIATGGYAILTVVARPEVRPIFTGLVTTVYSIANVIGPIMGGAFAEHSTWRWCFYVNLPFGGTAGVIIFLFFGSQTSIRPKELVSLREKISHLDVIGITLALGSLICFVRALQVAGTTKSWSSSEVIGLLVGFVALTLAFVLSQKLLHDRAMMVRKILRMRIIIVGMIFGFLHEGGFFTLLYALPIYFQAVSDVSPAQAGVRNIPLLLSCGVGSIAAGLLVSKFNHFVPLMIWASGGGCIGTGLIYTLDVTSPPSQWIGYQVLAGLAFGTGLPLAIISGQAYMKNEDVPSATAMLLFAFNVGSALALAAAQSILDNLLLKHLPELAPTVDPQAVIQAGATEIRATFAADAVPGIVQAYLKGLRAVYVLIIAFTAAATLAAAANRWERLSLKK